MYVCMCNPFTDKDVSNHLLTLGCKTTLGKTYQACSGGAKMNCGSCSCELKKMVDTHNNALTIENISDNMQKTLQDAKETV